MEGWPVTQACSQSCEGTCLPVRALGLSTRAVTTSSGALQFATGTRGVGTLPGKCGEDETLAVWGHVIRVPKWCGIARRKQRADLAQFKLSARRVHAGNVDMRHAARDLSDDQWSVLDPGLSFPGSTQVHGVPDQPWPRSSGRLRIQVGHLRKRISHPLTAVSAPHMWLCPECWPDQKS